MTFSTLGTDTTTNQPVTINKTVRPQGLYIVGRQGTGKSGLLENLIIQDIKQGLGVCVVDPHHTGGIIDTIIARLPANREQDVILLDIRDYQYPFGLNLFTCSNLNDPVAFQEVVDRVMHIFEKLFSVTYDTPLLWEYLSSYIHTIVANPGYTMAEIPLLLTDKNSRQKLVTSVKKSEVLRFWQRYELLRPDEQEVRFSPTLRRVDALLQDITLHIVGQEKSTIDFRAIMDDQKILLVKLDNLRLSSVTNLIGSLFIAAFLTAASTRMRKQNIFNIYADEFQNFATEDFVKLIEEARKFGIGITIAHQNRAQLELSNKQAEIELKKRVLNVGSLVVFCVPTDANELAGQFDTTPPPGELRREEKLEPVRDVVGHLARVGYPDRVVEYFVKEIVMPIYEAINEEVRIKDKIPYKLGWTSKKELLDMLNTLFYEVMVTQNPQKIVPPKLFHALAKVASEVISVDHFIGFPMLFKALEKNLVRFEGYSQVHFKPYEYWSDKSDVKQLLDSLWVNPELYENAMLIEIADFKELISILIIRSIPDNIGSKEKMDEWVVKMVDEEVNQFILFFSYLRNTMRASAKEPVTTGSGIYEMKQVGQLSSDEMRNRIANELVDLPDYVARVKIKGEPEHLIQTLDPKKQADKSLYGQLLDNRIERIKRHNRTAGYTRPRQDVEVEISMRQDALRQAAQPQKTVQEPLPMKRKYPVAEPVKPVAASDSNLEQAIAALTPERWQKERDDGLIDDTLTYAAWYTQEVKKLLKHG